MINIKVYGLDGPAADTSLRSQAATLRPWRCDGALDSGKPCDKKLAEVDFGRPMYVRIVCNRCGKSNTLVERYAPRSATMGTSPTP